MPIVMMLMFVYMLGNAFSVGVKYIDYATPGMILLAITYGLSATATEVNSDMTTGLINRLRVMDVSRGAVLTGHVIVTMLRTLLSIAAIIGVVAYFVSAPIVLGGVAATLGIEGRRRDEGRERMATVAVVVGALACIAGTTLWLMGA
jgi:hypothetical protein